MTTAVLLFMICAISSFTAICQFPRRRISESRHKKRDINTICPVFYLSAVSMALFFSDQVQGILDFLVACMPVHHQKHHTGNKAPENDDHSIDGQIQ